MQINHEKDQRRIITGTKKVTTKTKPLHTHGRKMESEFFLKNPANSRLHYMNRNQLQIKKLKKSSTKNAEIVNFKKKLIKAESRQNYRS